MLVLSRHIGFASRLIVGSAVVEVVEALGSRIRMGFRAPKDCPVIRMELALDAIRSSLRCDIAPDERSDLELALLILEDVEVSDADILAVLQLPAMIELVWGWSGDDVAQPSVIHHDVAA